MANNATIAGGVPIHIRELAQGLVSGNGLMAAYVDACEEVGIGESARFHLEQCIPGMNCIFVDALIHNQFSMLFKQVKTEEKTAVEAMFGRKFRE